MGFVQSRRPSGMVDGDIEEDFTQSGVYGIHQLEELLQRCGFGIEYRQGRIDFGEAQGGIGAAEAPHATIGGGRRVDGQQLQPAAPQTAHDEIELTDQIAEGSRWGNHRIAGLIQPLNELGCGRRHRPGAAFIGTELTNEGIVDDVAATRVRRFHIDDGVGTLRPLRLTAVHGDKEALGFEMTHFRKTDGGFEHARSGFLHGHIEPVAPEPGLVMLHPANNLPAHGMGMAQVGAQLCPTGSRRFNTQAEHHHIAAKPEAAIAGRRFLDDRTQGRSLDFGF